MIVAQNIAILKKFYTKKSLDREKYVILQQKLAIFNIQSQTFFKSAFLQERFAISSCKDTFLTN